MSENRSRRENIHLGTHGEKYGNWMSAPVFYMVGGLLALAVVLAILSFTVFRLTVLGVIFTAAAAVLPPHELGPAVRIEFIHIAFTPLLKNFCPSICARRGRRSGR